jgi:hypothetical protein
MSSLVISGDTSGAVTLAAPAVAGTNTLTLQAATATNAVNTLSTAVPSTSGTAIDFTNIPSWCKRVTVMFQGVSTNGTNNLQIQLGAGSVTTSGYAGSVSYGGSGATTFNSTGLLIYSLVVAAQNHQGAVTLTLLGSNTWVSVGNLAANASSATCFSAGAIALSGTLDRIRIIASATGSPADTFDAGTINLLLEG